MAWDHVEIRNEGECLLRRMGESDPINAHYAIGLFRPGSSEYSRVWQKIPSVAALTTAWRDRQAAGDDRLRCNARRSCFR